MNFLDVRLELASGDTGNLTTNAAQVLGFASPGNLIAKRRAFAGIMTFS